MVSNKSLDTISKSIEDLSRYATTLGEQYVIDSPAVALDPGGHTFVRVGRWKTGKTLLFSTKAGEEELLTGAPIRAKVYFLEIFEEFFASYAGHATRFWQDVDRAILKCEGCVSAARGAVEIAAAKVEQENFQRKVRT